MDIPVIDGLFVFILGFSIVFLGMVIIVLAVTLFGKIFSITKTQPKKPKIETQPQVESNVLDNEEEIPEYVKVAIISAISAYYLNTNSKCDFVVKKIKRF